MSKMELPGDLLEIISLYATWPTTFSVLVLGPSGFRSLYNPSHPLWHNKLAVTTRGLYNLGGTDLLYDYWLRDDRGGGKLARIPYHPADTSITDFPMTIDRVWIESKDTTKYTLLVQNGPEWSRVTLPFDRTIIPYKSVEIPGEKIQLAPHRSVT